MPERNSIPVLNYGYVELVCWMADDSLICDTARVIPEKEIKDGLEDKDKDLLMILLTESPPHGSPTEGAVFRFRIKLPLFVMREWIRHRIASYNEMSLRWQKAAPQFYVPQPEDVRRVTPGKRRIEYSYISADIETAVRFIDDLNEFHEYCWRMYDKWFDVVAPEQARFFIPTTWFTMFIWTVNARSLMNFLELRNDDHAQYELQCFASAIEDHFRSVLPITYKNFIRAGRRAP